MSDEELQQKFRECAKWGGLDESTAQRVIDCVWKIESLANLRELTRLLVRPRRS